MPLNVFEPFDVVTGCSYTFLIHFLLTQQTRPVGTRQEGDPSQNLYTEGTLARGWGSTSTKEMRDMES
jgi:hypothetical protein